MLKIIPGGYYNYDSANRKLWLDYSFYNVAVENIDLIKNLTSNKIMYSAKNPQYPVTVENGCITHSYPSAGADADKIQIVLRTPIIDSLTELEAVDGVISLETTGKVLVLPTGSDILLPSFNEYVLNSNRLTVAESPFGGLKGAGSPDYAVGTVFCQTDGVYLTDTSGTNSTKTLTAGKLKELSLLTVDTTAHTITEEFILRNDNAGSDVTVIDACDVTTEWLKNNANGDITFSVESGTLKAAGYSDFTYNSFSSKKALTTDLSISTFISFRIKSSVSGSMYFQLVDTSGNYKQWSGARFSVVANTWHTFILPLKSPTGTTGTLPSSSSGTLALNSMSIMRFGIGVASPNMSCNFYLDDIQVCNGTPTYVECNVPDTLSTTSTIIQCYSGSTYSECRRDSLDGTYANISSTPANMKMLDGTKFDDVYGANLGRAYFPKGISAATVTGSTGTMTYSANKGTSQRIGSMVSLPPSDGGRTNFNKIRLKIITYYAALSGNYSASYDFADSTSTSYGLQNLANPWIALYDPANSLIDFYRFTVRPQNMTFKRNEAGIIHELSLYPGTGKIYHGQISFTGLTTDTDSDLIPDCLEAAVNGSVTKFLEHYTMEV